METEVAKVGDQKQKRKLGNDNKNGESNSNSGGDQEHEVRIMIERARRKKMKTMFSNLHALLPNLSPKTDKSSIVDEAIKSVKALEQTIEQLEKQKQEKLNGTLTHIGSSIEPSVISTQTEGIESREAFLASKSRNFSMTTNNMAQAYDDIFPISLRPPTCFQTWLAPNVVMSICGDDAQISVCSVKRPDMLTTIFYILEKHKLDVMSAHVSSDQFRSIYMIHVRASGGSGHYPEALSVEDTFKLVAGEMNLWLMSF